MSTPHSTRVQQFAGTFFDHFSLELADTASLLNDAYRLRFQVYCRELCYEPEARYPNGLESDRFDARSLSVLLRHSASGRLAGCVRLIFADPHDPAQPFPFEQVAIEQLAAHSDVFRNTPRCKIGEVSRLAVIADFRRRKTDQEQGLYAVQHFLPAAADSRRHNIPPAIGLVFAAACLGLDLGLEAVFVMMEVRLARLLRGLGLAFRQVAAPIDYHGLRAPFEMDRSMLLGDMPPALQGALAAVRARTGALHGRARARMPGGDVTT